MMKRRLAVCVWALGFSALAQAENPYTGTQGSYGGSYAVPDSAAGGAYVGGGISVPSSPQGELFMQLQQIQQELSHLSGVVEVQQNEIKRLQQEALERYQDLDGRIQSLSNVAPATNDAAAPINANGPLTAPAASEQPAADPATEKLYYDAAFDLIKAKDFDKASLAFNAFLRKYPASQFAGNAQYWLGEIDLVKGDLTAANKAFALVAQNYPKHGKVPDALYKMADVERRLGSPEKAKTIWRQIVAQYPGTSAAQLAQQDLQR